VLLLADHEREELQRHLAITEGKKMLLPSSLSVKISKRLTSSTLCIYSVADPVLQLVKHTHNAYCFCTIAPIPPFANAERARDTEISYDNLNTVSQVFKANLVNFASNSVNLRRKFKKLWYVTSTSNYE
jgi:hypothetical protein